MASSYDSFEQFEVERAREAWSADQLKPRPGFGFYPDYVWDALEGFTAVGSIFKFSRILRFFF